MAGVADALRALTDEELGGLLTLRPDLLHPPLGSFNELATRVSQPHVLHSAIERLDLFARELLDAIAYLNTATPSGIVALAAQPIDPGVVEAGLDGLLKQLLVLRRGDGTWRLLPALERMISAPFGLGLSYERLFTAMTVDDLRHLANGLRFPAVTPKPDFISQLGAYLEAPGRIESFIEEGGPEVGDLLRAVLSGGSTAIAPTQLYQRHRLAAPVRYAVDHGLLVAVGWDTLSLPSAVGKVLLGGHVVVEFHPRPAKVVATDRPLRRDEHCELSPAGVIDAVARIGRHWSAAPVPGLKSGAGGVSIREARALAKTLGVPDRAAARLVELAGAAQLVAHDWHVDRITPTDEFDSWLALSAPERWLALVEAWKLSPVELSRAGARDHNDKPIAPLARDYINDCDGAWRRAQVVAAVASLEQGQHADPVSIVQAVTWGSPRRWSHRNVAMNPVPFSPLELVTDALDELALLGLAKGDGLTEAGRAALLGPPSEAMAAALGGFPPAVTTYKVSGDLTAVVPGEIDPRVLTVLEAMADTESHGSATVYRITEGSVRRALDRGHTPDELLLHLEEHARPAVPQSLRYLIDDVGRRYGAIRAGTAVSYVRSDDPALLAELARSRRTAKAKLRLIAPTVAVSSIAVEKVIPILREAGFMPVQEDESGAIVVATPKSSRAKQALGRRTDVDRKAEREWTAGLGDASFGSSAAVNQASAVAEAAAFVAGAKAKAKVKVKISDAARETAKRLRRAG